MISRNCWVESGQILRWSPPPRDWESLIVPFSCFTLYIKEHQNLDSRIENTGRTNAVGFPKFLCSLVTDAALFFTDLLTPLVRLQMVLK